MSDAVTDADILSLGCPGAGLDELTGDMERSRYATSVGSVDMTEYKSSDSSSLSTLTCTVLMVLRNFAFCFSDLLLSLTLTLQICFLKTVDYIRQSIPYLFLRFVSILV